MDQTRTYQLLSQILRVDDPVESVPIETTPFSTEQWKAICHCATLHGVAPLLHRHLAQQTSGLWAPPAIAQTLEAHRHATAHFNLRLYSQLARVLEVFQSGGIPVVLLKGAHLARWVYDSVTLRTMGDLDLLVPKPQLEQAESLLLQAGYRRARHAGGRHRLPDRHQLSPLVKPGAVPIELHGAILRTHNPFAIDLDGLWKRVRPISLAGIETLVLSVEDLLLHLCLHTSYQHGFSQGIRPLYDIAEVVRGAGGQVDWDILVHRCQEWSIQAHTYLPLYVTQKLLGANVPADLLNELKPISADSLDLTPFQRRLLANHKDFSSHFDHLVGVWQWKPKAPPSLLRKIFLTKGKLARIYSPDAKASLARLYTLRFQDLLLRYIFEPVRSSLGSRPKAKHRR